MNITKKIPQIIKKSLIVYFVTYVSINYSFNYEHETFILSPDQEKSFALPADTKKIAYNANKYLNMSNFFNTKLIQQSKEVLKEFNRDPNHQEIVIKTHDGQNLTCSYFNRNKNKVIVVGPGFTNSKEKMAPFAHMFLDYDVLLMNFRGHGIKKELCMNPLYNNFGIDGNARIGALEENDILAVINHLKNLTHDNGIKKYEQINGLGVCLGAFIFTKHQAIAEEHNLPRFDKLIVDGAWLSVNNFIKKIYTDPYLMINPQQGGSSKEIKWLLNGRIGKTIEAFAQWYLGVDLNKIDNQDYLNKIKETPILLFYGKNDLTIDRQDFEQIWNNISSKNKLGVITSNPHVHNHLKTKEIYKLICELFIESENTNKVSELLNNENLLKDYLISKLQRQLEMPLENPLNPNKFQELNSVMSILNEYKLTIIASGSLIIAYKLKKISWHTIKKLIAAYGMYQFIMHTWRPCLRLMANI